MVFIAGGCFKNIYLDQSPKDIDIFFTNATEFAKAEVYFKGNKDYLNIYTTAKVSAYKEKSTGIVLELNKFCFGTVEEVLSSFDFTICKYALYMIIDEKATVHYKVIYSNRFFEDLFKQTLYVDDKMKFPISTFNRCFKYARKGFFPCTETKRKIVENIQKDKTLTTDDIPESMYDGID